MLLSVVLLAAGSTIIAGLGLLALPWVLLALRRWTDWHRRLAGGLLATTIPTRYQPLSGSAGQRLRQMLTDRTTWRDLAWSLIQMLIGLPLAALALVVAVGPPLTVVSMLFWWVPDEPVHLLTGVPLDNWPSAIGFGLLNLALMVALGLVAVPPLARGHAHLTRALLARPAAQQLAERVETLTQTRADAIDAHGAELARIERDLHDGTQARLVAIAMRLGIAKQELAGEPGLLARLIDEAHDSAETAMHELRTIIRTMYPPVLADLGLAGAVHALAAQSPVPTHLDLGRLGTLPAAVEAAAYYAISEALTNVAKHSDAGTATVSIRQAGGWLRTSITDDGRGGADESGGSGITGIRQRIAALDGTVQVISPPDGPTSITVSLPCGS